MPTPRANTPTAVTSVRGDTYARPGIEGHSVRLRLFRVKPTTGELPIERRRRRVLGRAQSPSTVRGVDHRAQRCSDDGRVDPDAPDDLAVNVRLDVRGRRRVLSSAHRVLVVVEHVHLRAELAGERGHQRVDRPVALALDDALDS